MKKLLLLLLLSLCLASFAAWAMSPVFLQQVSGAIDWDLLDEDCADFNTPTWVDNDDGVAVSEIDPAGQFRLDTNAGAAGNDFAKRTADIGSYPNESTHEFKVYHDDIGTQTNTDLFQWIARQATKSIITRFCSDGLFVRHNGAYTEVGTNLVKEAGTAEWQTWRFLIDFSNTTCDIYLNDSTHSWEKVGTSIDCNSTGTYTDGETALAQFGSTTDNMVSHVDCIKAATGLYRP